MRKKFITGLLGLCIFLTACGSTKLSEETTAVSETNDSFEPSLVGSYEAEDQLLLGNTKIGTQKSGYSGTGYVEGFADENDGCLFTVYIEETGFYDLNFVQASNGGEKYNYITVDGNEVGTVYVEETDYTDSIIERIYLETGSHEIEISKYWGWIYLDRLDITTSKPVDASIYQVTAPLTNENASQNAKKLYEYLTSIYGSKILSGQYCDTGMYGKEFQIIKKTTGKTPAVLGLDLMNYSPTNVKNGTVGYSIDYAIDFWEQGGISTFCWHWTVPEKYLTGTWYSSFYKEHTNINLAKIMNGEDEEGYELLMADIDAIAEVLQPLKEKDVPILFRPLHEASGGWFWWGTAGPEAYKKLYVAMYEKLVNEYELNNLIWVWNGQDAEWYPGDEYVDIIGEDIYPGEHVYTSQGSKFLEAVNYSEERKLVYLTENGCVFDPELVKRDNTMWGMWCTWSGEFVAKDTNIYTLSEQYTEKEMLIKAYEDEDVLTLEDLHILD